MASFVTNKGAFDLQVGTSGTQINWASDTIRVRLVASSFTPDQDDTSMTGYTAIGTDQTLGSKTFAKDDANNRTVYDGADPTWTAVAGGSTIGWIVFYKFVTNDAGSTPIFVHDVTNTATNGGDVTYTIHADGIGYTQQ